MALDHTLTSERNKPLETSSSLFAIRRSLFGRRRRPTAPDSISMPFEWRRRGLAAFIAGILILLLVCDRFYRGPAQGDDWTRYHDRTFRVARVVDGDTIDIQAPDEDKPVTRIRLWGVDTPETARVSGPNMHFGREAKDFAERTLEGRSVHIVLSPKRTRGKYGRLLAYVFLERGGRMFNELLLEEGFAYADLRFEHHYFRQFQSIEKRARKAGAGLWAEVTPEAMPPWKQRFELAGKPSDE
jgi:micrococcal nuclease